MNYLAVCQFVVVFALYMNVVHSAPPPTLLGIDVLETVWNAMRRLIHEDTVKQVRRMSVLAQLDGPNVSYRSVDLNLIETNRGDTYFGFSKIGANGPEPVGTAWRFMSTRCDDTNSPVIEVRGIPGTNNPQVPWQLTFQDTNEAASFVNALRQR